MFYLQCRALMGGKGYGFADVLGDEDYGRAKAPTTAGKIVDLQQNLTHFTA